MSLSAGLLDHPDNSESKYDSSDGAAAPPQEEHEVPHETQCLCMCLSRDSGEADAGRATPRGGAAASPPPDQPDGGAASSETNEHWVEVDQVFGDPPPGAPLGSGRLPEAEVNRRSVSVRLETMGEWELTLGVVLLTGGIVLPYLGTEVAKRISDDDLVQSPDSCEVDPMNATKVSSVEACEFEAGLRLDISYALGAALAVWLAAVAWHWGRRPKLWLQHGATFLFACGQLLLEDPWSAWLVKYRGDYSKFTTNGQLKGTQPEGCCAMTLATLLLLDHCIRSGTRFEAQVGPTWGKLPLVLLASLWPLCWYELDDLDSRVDAALPLDPR